jgi:hypothetical protein
MKEAANATEPGNRSLPPIVKNGPEKRNNNKKRDGTFPAV